jgi:hypothetical protein
MSDIERELRESLAENARRAPAGDGLAERIIADAQFGRGAHDRRSGRSRWRAWLLPAIAAACVAGVVASIAIVASLQHPKTHSANTPSFSVTPPTGGAASSTAPVTTTAPSSSHGASGASTSAVPGIGPVPKGFQAADLTFVSTEDGWALGSGQCFKNPSQSCTALLRTSNGGKDWMSVMNPPAEVGTCDLCIAHIRFANDKIGYAYGRNVLFMTTDAGTHWIPQKGGADALETLSDNVIRVTDGGGCPPGCSYQVRTAAVGSEQWQAARLPGTVSGNSVLLNRTGHAAYLLIQQHPAGGAGMQQPTLLTSSDNGRTWANPGHTPCPQDSGRSGEIDGSLMTTAEDGSLSLVCTARGGPPSAQFTVTSTNGGTTFRPGSRGAFGDMAEALGAASSSVLVVSADDMYRSTDGGQSWHPLGAAGPGKASWIGFESATVGRAISANYRTIWTTTDAGATWSNHTFQ